jgi:hypothetical protein
MGRVVWCDASFIRRRKEETQTGSESSFSKSISLYTLPVLNHIRADSIAGERIRAHTADLERRADENERKICHLQRYSWYFKVRANYFEKQVASLQREIAFSKQSADLGDSKVDRVMEDPFPEEVTRGA